MTGTGLRALTYLQFGIGSICRRVVGAISFYAPYLLPPRAFTVLATRHSFGEQTRYRTHGRFSHQSARRQARQSPYPSPPLVFHVLSTSPFSGRFGAFTLVAHSPTLPLGWHQSGSPLDRLLVQAVVFYRGRISLLSLCDRRGDRLRQYFSRRHGESSNSPSCASPPRPGATEPWGTDRGGPLLPGLREWLHPPKKLIFIASPRDGSGSDSTSILTWQEPLGEAQRSVIPERGLGIPGGRGSFSSWGWRSIAYRPPSNTRVELADQCRGGRCRAVRSWPHLFASFCPPAGQQLDAGYSWGAIFALGHHMSEQIDSAMASLRLLGL